MMDWLNWTVMDFLPPYWQTQKKIGMRNREQKNCELFEHTINGEKEKNILYIYQTDRATFN